MPSVFQGLVPRHVMAGHVGTMRAHAGTDILRSMLPHKAGAVRPHEVAMAAMAGAGGSPRYPSPSYRMTKTGSLADAQATVANFDFAVSQGDDSLSSGDYDGAVRNYKMAGYGGAANGGILLDDASNYASQPYTTSAWNVNNQLANMPDSGNTYATAQSAQALAKQMSTLYHQSLSLVPPPDYSVGAAAADNGGNLDAEVAVPAQAAMDAINADPNFCVSVGQTGSAVNSTVHAFKAAWNAANPDQAVPIGTGKFEDATAQALSSALGGINVPGCAGGGGGAPTPGPAPAPAPHPAPAPLPMPVMKQAGFCGTWGWKCILGAVVAAILGFIAMHAATHGGALPKLAPPPAK